MELFGCQRVGLVNGLDVVLAVVGWESDAGERYLYVSVLERGDDLIEAGAGGGDGKAAESVVASELDDGDGGVGGDYAVESRDTVLGGVSADAHVEDAIVVAA